MSLLADAYGACGRVEDGLVLIGEAATSIERTGESYSEAEVRRVRGRLLLQSGDAAAAEMPFQEALRVARKQGARGWELRAALALSAVPGRRAGGEERDALVALFNTFREGSTTADLRAARAVIAGR